MNIPYVVALHFVQSASVYIFAATIGNTGGVPDVSYFPLDGLGFNDTAQGADGKMHNFPFTTEIHTSFTYNGGETASVLIRRQIPMSRAVWTRYTVASS